MRSVYWAAIAVVILSSPARSAELTYEDLTEDETTAAVEYVVGNALYTMLHESGHMLISEFDLPVLGREEDAVDNLATIMLLEGGSEAFEQALADRADGSWTKHELAAAADDAEEDHSAYYDEHGLDLQRSYQVICLMVGQDPDRFSDIADSYELPADRRERCGWEYQQVSDSWAKLLEPHQNTDGSGAAITVSYEETSDPELLWAYTVIKESRVLDTVAETMAQRYVLEPGITFTAKACGEANAYWYPAKREATFCYEYANFFGRIMLDWTAGERSGANAEETEGADAGDDTSDRQTSAQ
ncbi:DUF4344 domain-containing metallopeptidase [Chthonobacter albigriseus]|uniref:DUF4344 domain-containing metallopeptidase n=1 Tax=Chthonobacter albigriseus TaxID=1683161 RepID=UPI0015EFB1ED|nr:DUF4344 domain-containing metallopeptidase [Chthonobacter albigriseus]